VVLRQDSIYAFAPTLNVSLGALGIGVLAGGYVVDLNSSGELDLWDFTTDTPSIIDTLDPAPWTVDSWTGFALRYGNDTGSLILGASNAGAYGFGRVTASGGVLACSFTTNAGATFFAPDLLPAGDGTDSAVVLQSGTTFLTTDLSGSDVGSYAPSSGVLAEPCVYHPRSDRIVTHIRSADTVYLRQSDGTVIDSIAIRTTGATTVRWTATGSDRTTYFYYGGSGVTYFRTLDTSGDVLSWVTAEQSITLADQTIPYAWAGQVAMAPFDGSPYTFLDPVSGAYATSTTTVGAFSLPRPVSLTRTLAAPDTGTDSHLLAAATGPTYLRQRQSAVRAPSRVSWKGY